MKQLKQVIVLREDLGISEGKKISQACHASLGAYRKTPKKRQEKWRKSGDKKIILEAEKEEIKKRFQNAKNKDLPTFLVKDAGQTEITPGTITAIGVGPAPENKINKITGDLKLVK